MNHISGARFAPLDMSSYEAEPSDEQEHALHCIELAMRHLTEAYRQINLIPMDKGPWPDAIRETLDGLGELQGQLDQAQADIFDEIQDRDDELDWAGDRNDERRGDE